MKKIVLVTGGFDPIHSGHIEYFRAAKALGDELIVGINSDAWLSRKKGQEFMPFKERRAIIQALKMVDGTVEFNDDDNSSINAIHKVRLNYPSEKIIFANGGDRTKDNIPEMSYRDDNVQFKFGVGGTAKMNSSSWILQEWKAPKTIRPWGYYRVLHEPSQAVKLKELTVDPGQSLSMQRHKDRAEFWFVSEGTATVNTINNRTTDCESKGVYERFKTIPIETNEWHQLKNNTTDPLKIIEIQYGDRCIEEDIERK
jgi:D-beta-D-heptose 7-phosphate kinase/D-beta-D-heptose 1-phosphate adenosyltransferase